MKYIHQIITTLNRYIVLIETSREEQAHRVFTGDEFNRIATRVLKNNSTGDIFKAKADLLQAKVIRKAPRVEGSFQLDRRVSRFLNEMAEQESIGLSGNIRIEVEQLSSLIAQLSDTIARNDKLNSDQYLEQTDLRLSNLQSQSSVNEKAILRAVEKSKSYPPSFTVKQRYKEANDLWEQYIIPMLEMIEPQGLFSRTLTELENKLRGYRRDGQLMLVTQREVMEQVIFRILDLRAEMSSSIHRSQIKLAPLREAYRKATRLSRSISDALTYLANTRFKYADNFPIPDVSKRYSPALTDGDTEIDAYIAGLSQYSPEKTYLSDVQDSERGAPTLYPDVLNQLKESVPIDDTFQWLLDNYPDISTAYMLQIFLRLTSMEPQLASAMKERKRYETLTHRIDMPRRELSGK